MMLRTELVLQALLALLSSTLVDGDAMESVTFWSFSRDQLELRWDNGAGEGIVNGVIPSMDSITLGRTFEGHKFHAVRQSDGERLATFVMTKGQQTYVVEPKEEDRQHPAYAAFLAEQRSSPVLAELDALHAAGRLKAVSFQSRTRPKKVRGAFGIVMKNFRRYSVSIYWDDGSKDGVFNGEISPMGRTGSMTTYPGDAFILMRTTEDGGKAMVARFVMNLTQRSYVLEPDFSDEEAKTHPSYLKHQEVSKLESEYVARTGKAWLGAHPPDPATLPMYAPGSKMGEVVHTMSVRGLDGPRELVSLSWPPVGPRAFLLEGLMTAEECAHVIELAKDKLGVSGIGGGRASFESKTRTSKIAFINRATSAKLEAIHLKLADVLNVSDDQMRTAAEALQVVRYEQGQEYAPHYDYTPSTDRLATLLVYLGNDGGTSFPRAFEDRGLVIKPKQGDAILFYSQLPDGNLDELSLHAGMKVSGGTKWVCNLWLHSHGDRGWQLKSEL